MVDPAGGGERVGDTGCWDWACLSVTRALSLAWCSLSAGVWVLGFGVAPVAVSLGAVLGPVSVTLGRVGAARGWCPRRSGRMIPLRMEAECRGRVGDAAWE